MMQANTPAINESDYCPECGWYVGDDDGRDTHGIC